MAVGLRVVEVYAGEVGHDAPPLVRELVRRGIAVAVVGPPGAAEAFAGTGAEVTPLAVGTGVGSLAALRRVLRGGVVHAHGLRAAAAVMIARTNATPVVVSLTEAPRTGGAGGFVARSVIRAATAVLVPTPDLDEVAVGLGAREVGLVLPPRPDAAVVERTAEQVREELALPPDGPIVLAAARLHADARLDVLVEAATRWRRRLREPQVVLVGVGPAYRALVARTTVARAPVTFAGDRTVGSGRTVEDRRATVVSRPRGPDAASVAAGSAGAGDHADGEPPATDRVDERASLADLLAAASVAVVTDPRALPWFALAAGQAGVALVVPLGGVVAGLLGDAVLAVPPGDVDALDEAVRALLNDDAARAELAAAARERVTALPDAAAVAGELAARYERASLATRAGAVDTPD